MNEIQRQTKLFLSNFCPFLFCICCLQSPTLFAQQNIFQDSSQLFLAREMYNEKSQFELVQTQPDSAIFWLTTCLPTFKSFEDYSYYLAAMNTITAAYCFADSFEKAHVYAQNTVDTGYYYLSEDNVFLGDAITQLAAINQLLGKWERVVENHEKSLQIELASPQRDVAKLASRYFYLGKAKKEQKDHLEAIAYFKQALKIYRDSLARAPAYD